MTEGEIAEMVWVVRSPDCTVPERCGQNGWRNCDACEAFQERLYSLIPASEAEKGATTPAEQIADVLERVADDIQDQEAQRV